MRRFIYKNEDGQQHIEAADMDLTQIAAEIGILCRELYNGLHRQDPGAASIFKTAVVMTIAHPDTPTWLIKPQTEGDVAICVMSKKPN